jgi:hypothetical protein
MMLAIAFIFSYLLLATAFLLFQDFEIFHGCILRIPSLNPSFFEGLPA